MDLSRTSIVVVGDNSRLEYVISETDVWIIIIGYNRISISHAVNQGRGGFFFGKEDDKFKFMTFVEHFLGQVNSIDELKTILRMVGAPDKNRDERVFELLNPEE